MKNAMFLLLMGIAPAGLFPLSTGAMPDGAAFDGFGGKAAVIESAQIPQTEPEDFGPFPMSGKKEGCVETCSVKDGGNYGGEGKDASTDEDMQDGSGGDAGGMED